MAIEIVSQLDDQQVRDLVAMYQREWWTPERREPDVRRMLASPGVIIGLCDRETRRLAGFARVITDYVYKALVLDVIVAPSHRSTGLGKTLMDAVVAHPALREVSHFELYCRSEMIPFYRRWGFTDEIGELRFMRLVREPS
jgi:GNAT superfamily N-acetyltransferase